MTECAITCQKCNNTLNPLVAKRLQVRVCLPLEMKSHNVSCKPPDNMNVLISQPNIMLWVLKRTEKGEGSFEHPKHMFILTGK